MKRKIKNLNGFNNDPSILSQYIVPYSTQDNNRYKHLDQLLLEDRKVIRATINPIDLGIMPFDGVSEHIVTADEENRIDIVATKIYGSASLYWILCYANSLEDPYDLPVGFPLIVPNISALRRFPNPLS